MKFRELVLVGVASLIIGACQTSPQSDNKSVAKSEPEQIKNVEMSNIEFPPSPLANIKSDKRARVNCKNDFFPPGQCQ